MILHDGLQLYFDEITLWEMQKYYLLEIPALQVFLDADAQLLGTSLAGTNMPLSRRCYKSLL